MRLKPMTGMALLVVLLAAVASLLSLRSSMHVRYVNTGSRDLETKAMQLLAKHCGEGGFRVANRTVQVTHRNVSGEPTQITIDAICL